MHPFAELIAEIAQARVTGSLRISDGDKKCVVYFKGGVIVFAVSNARSSRLFDMMLRRNKLKKEDLAETPNFANDIEFSAFLKANNFLTQEECDRLFSEQIEGIIVDILSWEKGNWSFSSLARIRDGLAYQTDVTKLLIDYARTLSVDKMLKRFRSLDERFVRSEVPESQYDLTPEEAFVLSRSTDGELSAQELVNVAAVSESTALQLIYTLWLSGLLERKEWQAAFSKASVAAMRSAKLELRTEARQPGSAEKIAIAEETPIVVAEEKPVESVVSLDEYLTRVENAATHYDILGVDIKADADELKRAYFSLAKMFHPDRFHSEGGEKLKRVQHAFTTLAQAHETLKAPQLREVYDYRMRKELAERSKREAEGTGNAGLEAEQATQNFDRGFTILMDKDHESALPFLARAAHFAPKNARYRAYFGKALAYDDKQSHKAESEMQAAVKIDPDNPTYRIMLAEFFIKVNLLKRAEGELNRLLAIFPSNREARNLLDSIKAKA